MTLTTEKIKNFRRIGHHLKPVVIISDNGISEGVAHELSRALDDHELIKIKLHCSDKAIKQKYLKELCESVACQLVQTIGNVALIYRGAAKPNPKLSNILRHQTR